MEAYVAEPTKEGKDPKTPLQAVAHVVPKSMFLRNVGLQSTEMKRKAKAAAMNDRAQVKSKGSFAPCLATSLYHLMLSSKLSYSIRL